MQSAAHHRGDPFFRLICRSAYSSLGYETPLQWPRMTNTHIVLLRAVNAGGVNSLPMKDFVQILENIGLGVLGLIFKLAMPLFALGNSI